MNLPRLVPTEDLQQDVYKASAAAPAGLLAAVAFQLQLLAEIAGAASADLLQFRVEIAADRSGRAIAADAIHLPRVDEYAEDNPARTCDRDAAIASGDLAAGCRRHDEAISRLRTIFSTASDSGVAVSSEVSTAAVFARSEE